MLAFLSGNEIAPWAQFFEQTRQPTQTSLLTIGFPLLCCSIFPARLPHPIPIFLIHPPNPAASCPLKWLRLINTSASIMARPIFASLITSPPSTGTATSSVPFRPSPMIIWHPVDRILKPFSYAALRCSRASFLLPTYSVLQSVRNGRPPSSFTTSATAFA